MISRGILLDLTIRIGSLPVVFSESDLTAMFRRQKRLSSRRSDGVSYPTNSMQTSNLLTEEAIATGLSNLRAALQRGRLPFVVLVEDDDLDASLFRSALRQAGVSVEFMRFDSAQQAIDFLKGKGSFADRDMYPLPNLTVLDWNLPRSSGLEVLEEIRAHP